MPPSSAFDQIIQALSRMPGIGRRSAERIAFDLLRRPTDEVLALADAIRDFKLKLTACSICGNVSEADPCPICSDVRRDRSRILVVEEPTDVVMLEQTGAYRGLYHVLMGRVAPLDGLGLGELNVERLIDRAREAEVIEVVLGLNPTLEGDGTAMTLTQALSPTGVRVTRLARGLPAGTSLKGLSKAVLSDAIQSRRSVGDP